MTAAQTTDRHSPDPADDGRHVLPAEGYGRESVVLMAHVPDECVVAAYTWVNAQGEAGYAACAFGPAAGEKAVFETEDKISVAASADFTDWKLGRFHLRQTKPLEEAVLQVDGTRLGIALDFSALHPAYAFSTASEDPREACPPFLATDRFEQAGRVRGAIRIGDREIEVDGLGHRDHSWGRRDWESMQHYRWLEGQAGAGADALAFNVIAIEAEGRGWVLGYVFRDGELAPLRSAGFDIDFDDYWVQDGLTVALDDRAGRTTVVHAERFARHEYPVGTNTKLVDTGMTFTVEGTDLHGAGYTNLSWPRDYLGHLRARTAS